ncbi:MAG: diaminopimelate epimerase [Bdellovibrionales bacterium CG12_big_fil_rev_8_21_14_0_65_38_15]|nr:MAG: diaminopimelate epimerase [Bdellovibrionales bacterium CG22_combo_CG10-13_8_21_14_all_38_13]PIQ54603.1 MAG: diaminopimelate epimerase [Bdellovibrionales bacterium CG12_big_fil_rev_8_21_14_0_65_38_15]
MKFWKYSGAGNDFILFSEVPHKFEQIDLAKLCDRKFGIGADGLLIVKTNEVSSDFQMIYYNSDGGQVEMCGNGARSCAHWFANEFHQTKIKFLTASNAAYEAEVISEDFIKVTMNELKDVAAIDVADFYPQNESLYLNTGVPHTVILLNQDQDIASTHWMKEAPKFRADKRFEKGCNINFVKVLKEGEVVLRTFERGVEAETLACGTGAVAAARFLNQKYNWNEINIKVAGGILKTEFIADQCWLAGPAKRIFEGDVNLDDFLI